jgi:hypothetical protein
MDDDQVGDYVNAGANPLGSFLPEGARSVDLDGTRFTGEQRIRLYSQPAA